MHVQCGTYYNMSFKWMFSAELSKTCVLDHILSAKIASFFEWVPNFWGLKTWISQFKFMFIAGTALIWVLNVGCVLRVGGRVRWCLYWHRIYIEAQWALRSEPVKSPPRQSRPLLGATFNNQILILGWCRGLGLKQGVLQRDNGIFFQPNYGLPFLFSQSCGFWYPLWHHTCCRGRGSRCRLHGRSHVRGVTDTKNT